jgi:hypothetical protein
MAGLWVRVTSERRRGWRPLGRLANRDETERELTAMLDPARTLRGE